MRLAITSLTAAATLALAAGAAEAQTTGEPQPLALGEIVVAASRGPGTSVGSHSLSARILQTYDRLTLDDAANLLPGVFASNTGGARNERVISVRGFNRFQVPLSIDGVRVFLPADNRLDLGRFLTSDLAEVQVAKGYASVLDGPDAMGGAINLVTRKPSRPIEAETREELQLGRDGEYAGYNLFALVGGRGDRGYAQASFTQSGLDHWDLSGGFRPTPTEDGGRRDRSQTSDLRMNLKAATPRRTPTNMSSATRAKPAASGRRSRPSIRSRSSASGPGPTGTSTACTSCPPPPSVTA